LAYSAVSADEMFGRGEQWAEPLVQTWCKLATKPLDVAKIPHCTFKGMLKGMVHTKRKILSLITHLDVVPKIVPNL